MIFLLRGMQHALICSLLVGCINPIGVSPTQIEAPKSSAVLRSGDGLSIRLLGIPDPSGYEVQIDDRGYISLPYIDRIQAAGLTSSELADNIRTTYISQQYYKHLSVSVYVTERYIYVGGEVAGPGRVVWTDDLTLSKAIQAAGGFSTYANEKSVQLTRDQNTYQLNSYTAQAEPNQDPKLYPGDAIHVPRSVF